MSTRQSNGYSGYIGAICIIMLCIISIMFIPNINEVKNTLLISMLVTTTSFMLAWEIISQHKYYPGGLLGDSVAALSLSNKYILRSTIFRYAALLVPWLLMNSMIQYHYYFQTDSFIFTREVFSKITWLIVYIGIPYIFITLKLRGHKKYEFNDYALLLLLLFKGIKGRISNNSYKHIFRNRRTHKIILVWLVVVFFLPLMILFYHIEFSSMYNSFDAWRNHNQTQTFYQNYTLVYQFFFHLIFVVDTGIAIIAYTISSRWLGNRVKSVDRTLQGWLIALLCYPPLNSGFTDKFIGYNLYPTQNIITSEVVQMFVWAIVLALFTIYVWATATLGFKFSNLCNRGIISNGPYRFIRHPAYTCKNIAWWLDNSYVLSSVPASLSLLVWNIMYIFRGITEERHLSNDPAYKAYCKIVTKRFFTNFK